MPVLKSVDILSMAKIFALFGVIVGLVLGIFYGLIAAAIGIGHNVPGFGAIVGVALVIVMPILLGVFGFISGVIHAFLYNVFAGWIGGIKFEFQQ